MFSESCCYYTQPGNAVVYALIIGNFFSFFFSLFVSENISFAFPFLSMQFQNFTAMPLGVDVLLPVPSSFIVFGTQWSLPICCSFLWLRPESWHCPLPPNTCAWLLGLLPLLSAGRFMGICFCLAKCSSGSQLCVILRGRENSGNNCGRQNLRAANWEEALRPVPRSTWTSLKSRIL